MQIHSFYQESIHPQKITIEIHSRFQIPSFQILGLPAPEIQEARERIIAAFGAAQFEFPKKRVIVNLAPSSIRKSGTGHDLGIALQVLSTVLDIKWPEKLFAWGELGLDGSVKPCGKTASLLELLIPEAVPVILAKEDALTLASLLEWRKMQGLKVPAQIKIYSIENLNEILEIFERPAFKLNGATPKSTTRESHLMPMHESLLRLTKISLVGRHHTLILGPKGVGKSHALGWFRALLPDPSPNQVWARILNHETRSLGTEPFSVHAPIREVHSQIKPSQLLGSFGPKGFRAGELSLAHGGIFVADEFLEWPRDSKECLRDPLQSKQVILTRTQGSTAFPCDVQLIGTGNLCPCGGLPAQFLALIPTSNKKNQRCHCRPGEVFHYFKKLSGPILDRIDLVTLYADSGAVAKERVPVKEHAIAIETARRFALERFGNLPSDLSVEWLEKNLPTPPQFQTLLERLPNLRSRHKVMRIARSIQALDASSELTEEQVFEAMTFRFMSSAIEGN